MIVKIKTKKLRLALPIPIALAGFAARMALKSEGEKRNLPVTFGKKQERALVKSLKQAKKEHGRLQMLYIKSSDGTKISIKL